MEILPSARAIVRVRLVATWHWPVLTAMLVLAALALGWIGYAASDDAAYYLAARHWLVAPPFAGHDHWATRFPLVIGLAAAMRVIGEGAAALTLVALSWYAAFLIAVHALAARIGGARAGWIATILLATMPVVVANATTASCDLTEATFLLVGILLIGDCAATRDATTRRAVGAGLAFGTAILCRETTALALLGFVPLFMLGRPVPRRAMIAMGLASAILLAGEALFQWLATGHALNRWDVAFHHDSHIDRAANLEGNVLVHPAIDPLLVLLVNDDFALIFWLAIAAVALRVDRMLAVPARRRMTILVALGLATFLLVGALYTRLVLNPRYFMLPAIGAAVAVAVWLDHASMRVRAAVLTVAIATNLLMLSIENTHSRWAAQALVTAARSLPTTPIVTDAATYHRALMPIAWNRLSMVEQDEPRPGALYFLPDDHIPVHATIVSRYPSPRTPLGAVLDDLGIARFVPASIRRRLLAPNPTASLVRVAG
ncbi:ArnT family glycosyltransferase [uncultured Sphingomonas sp.]|uniref:ArnT family glycosyltransferase n=1 Tax=uncultured Sphingomonas sp. TaxID=158754 RepID=UPI0035CBBC24